MTNGQPRTTVAPKAGGHRPENKVTDYSTLIQKTVSVESQHLPEVGRTSKNMKIDRKMSFELRRAMLFRSIEKQSTRRNPGKLVCAIRTVARCSLTQLQFGSLVHCKPNSVPKQSLVELLPGKGEVLDSISARTADFSIRGLKTDFLSHLKSEPSTYLNPGDSNWLRKSS